MTETKGLTLVQDMAHLCVIFPLEPAAAVSPSDVSSTFPDQSAAFRFLNEMHYFVILDPENVFHV